MVTKKQKLKKDGTPSKQGEGGNKYKTDEEVEKKVTKYLADCIREKQMPNKAGLLLEMEISKPTYNTYKKVFYSLKRFENAVENAWVQRLGGNSPTGAIFYLKNAFAEDFKDRHETDLTSGGKPLPIININELISSNNSNKENSTTDKED